MRVPEEDAEAGRKQQQGPPLCFLNIREIGMVPRSEVLKPHGLRLQEEQRFHHLCRGI
eukprot:CAMPEP_0170577534 /NCGR_PEP_ID=MMETSP0224-20130122/4978_1 /TAXON_ID=285029 /ORGANISM="Togula jolla, Strain CCCM 725" /LENGTH=57 /DNA_ID=CAMNT_0010900451 /DNA_START=501 /DNA_END=674 /DNA_ORIENTATION=-